MAILYWMGTDYSISLDTLYPNYRYELNGNIEWCWLNGEDYEYVPCEKHDDCKGVNMNSCAGSCAVGW